MTWAHEGQFVHGSGACKRWGRSYRVVNTQVDLLRVEDWARLIKSVYSAIVEIRLCSVSTKHSFNRGIPRRF